MVQELVQKIKEANELYRLGKPIISDKQYDILVDELNQLDPDNEILLTVGHEIQDESRKSRLPIEMASMNKIKTMEDIQDWCRLKSISTNEEIIITPKFDGLSLCVDELENQAWTRGDGVFGQKSDEHYKLIKNHLYEDTDDPMGVMPFRYTYGEVMMSKKTFLEKYSDDFANPRNFVAGLLNSPDARPALQDCNFIKYGGTYKYPFTTKQEVIDELNSGQRVKVNYTVCKISDLTEDMLIKIFHSYATDYEIDGLIIEINDLKLQDKLGRETSSNNPIWARAFKHSSFEQSAETTIIGISWNISKQGYLKPTLHIDPVKLDGVTVSNVTGNNARFVKDMGLGIGAKVVVKRSGMVIPIISEVLETVEFVMPNVTDIGWNDNEVELITLSETDEQRFKQAVSFLEILEVERVGEGVVRQLWDAGFNTIKSILEVTPDKLHKLEGFGKRKAVIVTNGIQSKIKEVPLSKFQHATGFFKGLGSKKLALLEHFESKPTLEQVMEIDGFAETSAKSYLESYDKFFEFAKELPISIVKKVEKESVGDDLAGTSFVFTGVRRADLEEIITSRGGKISGAVSKTTTHLIMKAVGSGSAKEKKAIDLGLKIMTVTDLETFLNN
jgi:NAD-dependent DNA ligase